LKLHKIFNVFVCHFDIWCFLTLSNWQGIVSWKYLVINYELVEKEKHINVNVQKRGFAFAKCIVSELLKDLIQNRKKQPLCEEDEIKLKKHNIHQKSCQCLYYIWGAEFL